MSKRIRFALLVVLLTLQAVGIAPITFAGADAQSTPIEHCPDDMGSGHRSDCPCCPDGGGMVAGCMSLCIAFVAPAAVDLPLLDSIPGHAVRFDEPALPTQTYPPLNPPPIA